jgi:hypothetical protein
MMAACRQTRGRGQRQERVRWQDGENRFESGGVVGGRGQARDFGLSALTSVGLPLADGSYSNFRRLAMADENSLIYVGFSSSR